MPKKDHSRKIKRTATNVTPVGLAGREYFRLRKQGKEINALDVRSADRLVKAAECWFIYDGKAVVIYDDEDPNGREWDRLNDLMCLKRLNQHRDLLRIQMEKEKMDFGEVICRIKNLQRLKPSHEFKPIQH